MGTMLWQLGLEVGTRMMMQAKPVKRHELKGLSICTPGGFPSDRVFAHTSQYSIHFHTLSILE